MLDGKFQSTFSGIRNLQAFNIVSESAILNARTRQAAIGYQYPDFMSTELSNGSPWAAAFNNLARCSILKRFDWRTDPALWGLKTTLSSTWNGYDAGAVFGLAAGSEG